jgi:hypothetical protein
MTFKSVQMALRYPGSRPSHIDMTDLESTDGMDLRLIETETRSFSRDIDMIEV